MSNKRTTVSDIFGVRKYNGPRIGIEVELEQALHPERGLEAITGKSYWTMVHDGSLRDNGVEYLSNGPFLHENLDEALEQLDAIFKAMPRSRATCRTGLHVHVNVSDMTREQVCNMVLLSVLYEPGLIWHCGEDRASNIYSLASSQGDYILGHINDMMVGSQHDFGRAVMCCRELKYSSLNVGAISAKGTLEYRMHRGTKSVQDVAKWVNILVGLRTIALEAESPDHIINGVDALRESAVDIGLSPSSITRRSERRANLLLLPKAPQMRWRENPAREERHDGEEGEIIGLDEIENPAEELRFTTRNGTTPGHDRTTQWRTAAEQMVRINRLEEDLRTLSNIIQTSRGVERFPYAVVRERHGRRQGQGYQIIPTGTRTTSDLSGIGSVVECLSVQNRRARRRYAAE